MAAPHSAAPPPTDQQVHTAVEDAYARRRALDDDDLHLWSDSPADALAYLLRHRRVPPEVQVTDARTALLLVRAERARLDALELQALDLCRRPGPHQVSWSALADDLGLSSPQAVDQRRNRLRRTASARVRPEAAVIRPGERERAWTDDNADRIRAVAAALLRAAPAVEAAGVPDAAEVLEDIELSLDGYRGTHLQHAALLALYRLLADALGDAVVTVPAARDGEALAIEYRHACG